MSGGLAAKRVCLTCLFEQGIDRDIKDGDERRCQALNIDHTSLRALDERFSASTDKQANVLIIVALSNSSLYLSLE